MAESLVMLGCEKLIIISPPLMNRYISAANMSFVVNDLLTRSFALDIRFLILQSCQTEPHKISAIGNVEP